MNRQICHPLILLIIGAIVSWSVTMAPAPAVSAETPQSYTGWIADNGQKHAA